MAVIYAVVRGLLDKIALRYAVSALLLIKKAYSQGEIGCNLTLGEKV
jgi:hypothetical protein